MWFSNVVILVYIGLISFYLFNDFFMYEEIKNEKNGRLIGSESANVQ